MNAKLSFRYRKKGLYVLKLRNGGNSDLFKKKSVQSYLTKYSSKRDDRKFFDEVRKVSIMT
jgi:hypothetical protein